MRSLRCLSLALALVAGSAGPQEASTAAAPVDAAALLAEARAARTANKPERMYPLLQRLRDEFDGTPEAAAGALMHVQIYHSLWLGGRLVASELHDELRAAESGRWYELPEAEELRQTVRAIAVELGEWLPIDEEIERGKRGEREGFQRCGELSLTLYSRIGAGDLRAPKLLVRAAECFEVAGLWPEAASAYERYLSRYPDHELVEYGLRRFARGHMATARFAEAAEYAERYAARYPKHWEAVKFLEDAHRVRRALGQPKRALAALDRLETMFRANPPVAAEHFWARRELLTTDDAREQHYSDYLSRYGRTGPRGLRPVAEAGLGRLMWLRACGGGDLLLGTCSSLTRPLWVVDERQPRTGQPRREAPPRCSEQWMMTVVRRRAPAKKPADKAQRMFSDVTRFAWRDLARELEGLAPERMAAVADAVAMSAFFTAEPGFSEFLAALADVVVAPAGGPLDALLVRAEQLAGELEPQYEALAARDDSARWSIAAAARIGQIAELRSQALLHREVPEAQRGAEARQAHCAELRERGAAHRAEAVAAYQRCVARSVSAGEFTEFTELCEASLSYLDPVRFPLAGELVGGPGAPESRPEWVGVQLEAPQQPVDPP